MINTIVSPVGVVEFKKRIYFDWVIRWAIIDKAGIPVANVDSKSSAIEIALLINKEHENNQGYMYEDNKDYSYLFKMGEEYKKKTYYSCLV
jgi:hypothetical protein